MSSKYLLTGASGFLGKYIYENLIAIGEVDTLGRSKSNSIHCDLGTEIPTISHEYKCIIHAAGKAHTIPRTQADIDDFDNVNYQGVCRLLEGLENSKKIPKSIIVISTVAVYGIDHGYNVSEEKDCKPNTPYGISKYKAEKEFLYFGEKYNINVVILRLPLIIGENAKGNFQEMIKAVKSGKFALIGGGGAQRSMVLAADIAQFIPQLLHNKGVYNLTDQYHPSYKLISTQICEYYLLKKVKNIPYFIAIPLAYIGSLIEFVTKRSFVFSLPRYKKMTQSLTFSDAKASVIGWKPNSVIENINENLN